MKAVSNFFLLKIALLLGLLACQRKTVPAVQDPTVWKKVKIDFSKLDSKGLAGSSPDGKVALNYEFCIPATDKAWRQVQKIDRTAVKNGGRGRVGCSEKEWLVIGTTQQKNYVRVLYDLAALPFVKRIEETFWE